MKETKILFLLFLLMNSKSLFAQVDFKIKNKAGYADEEISLVIDSYTNGLRALSTTFEEMDKVWNNDQKGKAAWDQRILDWNENELFVTWLGEAKEPRQVRLAHKRLRKMKKVMEEKRVHLIFQAPDKTFNCKWSKHAWTVPLGRVAIHCCPQFMFLSNSHKSKAFVHEIGHESGMPFHHKVYWRRAALRTAKERPIKALKNPENYAYLVMEYY